MDKSFLHLDLEIQIDTLIAANKIFNINPFHNNSYSNYDKCITGHLQLIPKINEITALKSDYQAMIDNDYFFQQPPGFEEIITGLKDLEGRINIAYSLD